MTQNPISQSVKDTEKATLKILMLHGYTQSGELFRAKARALEKHIQKRMPEYQVTFVYPTGPIALKPDDIPFQTSNEQQKTDDGSAPELLNAYAWWRRSNTADPPVYLGLDTGLEAIARILTDEGPFDGVIGFSQGAACAAMVASLLEPGRREAFEYFSDPVNANTYRTTNASTTQIPAESAGPTPIAGIPFPAVFSNVSHPPFRFVVCYSGFRAPGPRYRAFYERPQITTPVMHVIGSLDGIVDESRTRALMAACEGDPEADGRVIIHPGGHFLPSQRQYLDGVVSFIQRVLIGSEPLRDPAIIERAERLMGDKRNTGMAEVPVEDMDFPF
ncbi:hypothetical protein VTO42DRAFT_1599 [Malbranchea cinnamomea]